MTKVPTRPALRYFGGKWKLAPWIISHFPKHFKYVEPFGGAASVLLRKKPCKHEVYNDLDKHIVDLFKVLRDPDQAKVLIRKLELTPYSRTEFDGFYDLDEEQDPIEKARKIIALSFMSYSTDGFSKLNRTGFRAGANQKRYQSAAWDWYNFPKSLDAVIDRLKHVIIENRDAFEIIDIHDHENTLFYVDPPYPHSTRYDKRGYRFELDEDQHLQLLDKVKSLDGMVVLGTYENEMYNELLGEIWEKKTRKTLAQAGNGKSNKVATECLWLNPKVQEQQRQKDLFTTNQ